MVRRQVPVLVIVSRSGESEYQWLLEGLRHILMVSTFVITNSNYSLFCEEINRCSFAILYHSRNRGRINITDVTDSLYDKELRTLHDALGKKRVIAVIDDLDDSSHNTKENIRTNQPSLAALTWDIFLFSTQDKANGEVLRRKVEAIKDVISESVGTGRSQVDSIPINIYGQVDSNPVNVSGKDRSAALRSDGDGHQRKGYMNIVTLGISFYTAWNTYHHRSPGNVVVVVMWGVATCRALSMAVSAPVLPLSSWGRLTLSCVNSVASIYRTYYKLSPINAAVSALWITSSLMYSQPRSRRPLRGHYSSLISYTTILLTPWMGWQLQDAETVFSLMSQYLLRSPAVLAIEGI